MYKQRLTKIHFALLITLIVNFSFGLVIDIKLNAALIFVIKIIVYSSGIFLLLLSIKPWTYVSLYYSLYIVTPVAILISWMAEGLFGALLATIYFALLAPPEFIRESNDYELRRPYSGFFNNCCVYDIYQTQWFLFEHKVVQKKYEISPENIKYFNVNKANQTALLSFYDTYEKRDSTLVIKLK